jgi:hypothetical protein
MITYNRNSSSDTFYTELAFPSRSRTAELADTEGRLFLSGCYRKTIVDDPDGIESALCYERRAFQSMG